MSAGRLYLIGKSCIKWGTACKAGVLIKIGYALQEKAFNKLNTPRR